ncbi:MAG: Ig-like domain-containing protein [Bacteroidota bacterium]
MKPYQLCCFALAFVLFACKETIIEPQIPKELTNDLLHGDLIGRVLQKSSGAKVFVSQVDPIDSQLINPMDGSFAFRDLRIGNYDVTISTESFRIYQRTNVQIQGGGVTYLGDINLSTVPDLVDRFYPEDNGEIVYDWRYGRIAISILFTHPMDRVSVERAFSTVPASEGVFIWGNYTSAPMRTLYTDAAAGEFEPGATITTFSKVTAVTYSMSRKDSYVDTTYTVRISTEAHDTSGVHLRFPLTFRFSTVQSYTTIYGIQTSPMHGDINVEPISNSGILITFPRRMDPASTEAATSISPPMNRLFLWPDGNQMKIYTGGPFLSDTTINVTIAGTARDRDGIPLSQDFSFWFRTSPLRVQYTYPANAQLYVPLQQTIVLSFNSYVLLSSIQQAFSITPSITGSFAFAGTYPYDNPSQVVFTPAGNFQPNTKYTVTISTAAHDMYGVPMKGAYSFAFVTRPN